NKIGFDQVNSSDKHIVDVLNPGISVNKSADKITAYELENITYTFNITNTGDTPLQDVLVYDSILGLLFAGNLEANETKVIIFEVP
ncbi:MAG: hypothetical protein GWN01_16410, partial [Nitrosopumilaceae archaeon]|nr:hypothetical protein [Nitrosopumilaceae archaeon]NIX63020.1 hypothetical protein [Nitrosopumilaceae archaeon]